MLCLAGINKSHYLQTVHEKCGGFLLFTGSPWMHCSFPTRSQPYGGTHIYKSWKKAAPQFPLRDKGYRALWARMQLEIPKLINDNHVRRGHGTC